jgi:ribosomal-protein-alanine N-acetyltransferase
MHLDPEVMKTLGGVRTEDETRRWLRKNLGHWSLHGFGLWTFRDKTDGGFVRRCGLRRVQVDGANHVELGYALVKGYWGMGLATEMATAAVAVGFEKLGLENLIALVDAANTASRRVAERLGFRFERNAAWKSPPTMQLRLERSEWNTPQLFPDSSP